MAHLINRVTILGTGLIGGSFALALRKYTPDIHITGWDRSDVVRDAHSSGALHEALSGELAPALAKADLVYLALPIGATLDILPEVARLAAPHALVTDACSTKLRISEAAEELFLSPAATRKDSPLFLGGHPMAGKEFSGFAHADADLFRNNTYALIAPDREPELSAADGSLEEQAVPKLAVSSKTIAAEPRVSAFVKIIEKMGARPLWLGARQHDYAVGLASHLPQLAAVALGSFLYDHLDENGLPITLAGPGLRDSLRLAGSPYSTWRDIVLTNREMLSASLDLFARRLDDLRERLGSRDLEADFDASNELYKLLRGL